MKKGFALFLVFALVFGIAACSPAAPQTAAEDTAKVAEATEAPAEVAAAVEAAYSVEDPLIIRYGHNSTEPTDQQYYYAEQFKAALEEATGGRIVVEIFPGGQLGAVTEMVDMLKNGTLDMMSTDFANLQPYLPDAGVFGVPFTFSSAQHAVDACNPEKSEVMQSINQQLIDAAGIRFLGGFYRGTRELTCNFAVYGPADLDGVKIRGVAADLWTVMIKGMGAVPTAIDFSELATSLMTHVVEGEENPLNSIYSSKLYEVQDYCMMTNHMYSVLAFPFNEAKWQQLTAEDQKIIADIATEICNRSVQEGTDKEATARVELEKLGMTFITEADGLDNAAFQTGVQAALAEAYPQWTNYIESFMAMDQ